jgi:pimeloyl-ACP methyl ester carboxylesterase
MSSKAAASDVARPAVVFIHGAFRSARHLRDWPDLVRPFADPFLLNMPGHGGNPPLESPTVDAVAERIDAVLRRRMGDRKVLLVGESMGGTVSLAIGGKASGPVKAVFAADPPMTTGNLWNLAGHLRREMAGGSLNPQMTDFAREAFGITAEEKIKDKVYYRYLDDLRVPAYIAYGDVPLLPPGKKPRSPSVFDDSDQVEVLRRSSKVTLERIADCGHLVLFDRPIRCLEIIHALVQEHLVGEPVRNPSSPERP